MPKTVTIKELIQTCRNDVYINILVYPFALVIAKFIINVTKIKADQITIFSFLVVSLFSIYSLYSENIMFLLVGFCIFYILDFVDGRVASFRGGGSSKGAMLDLIVDRTSFSIVVIILFWFHLQEHETMEMFLLGCYAIGFFWLEAIGCAKYIRSVQDNNHLIKQSVNKHSGFKLFFDLTNWLPNRLTSYIFIIFGCILFDSFQVGYILGLMALLSDIIVNLKARK